MFCVGEMMFSYTWNSRIFFVAQCVLAFVSLSKGNFSFAKEQNDEQKITAAQFYAELAGESAYFKFYHLETTFMFCGYGDRLYNMAEAISAECWLTAKATVLMLEQLKIFEEVNEQLEMAINATLRHIQSGAEKKHPAELVCSRVEKLLVGNANLSGAFDRAKMAAKKSSVGRQRRQPYSNTIFDSLVEFGFFVLDKIREPQVARSMASEMFRHQLSPSMAHSSRHHLFAKCVVAVAGKTGVADTMQAAYEKTLDEITPQVAANVQLATMFLSDARTLWFLPKMAQILYALIAKNEILKKEFDRTAVIIGKEFGKENLEFSTL